MEDVEEWEERGSSSSDDENVVTDYIHIFFGAFRYLIRLPKISTPTLNEDEDGEIERMEDVEEWEEGSSSSDDENVVADYTDISFGAFRGLIRLPKTSTPTLNEDEDGEIINDEKEKESVVSTPYKPTTTTTTHQQNLIARDSEPPPLPTEAMPHNGDALSDQPKEEAENGEPQAVEVKP